MLLHRILGSVLSVLILAATPGFAQESKAAKAAAPAASAAKVPDGGMPHYIRPETPEQRMERLGTTEDPGVDPDPARVWVRFGHKYTIMKVDKKWVKPSPTPGLVRANRNVNVLDELYQENDKYAWVWVAEVPPLPSAKERAEMAKYEQFSETSLKYLASIRDDFEPLEPPKVDKKVRFESSSEGLPTTGSWRNALAVGDMNGDKHVDLIVPSQRGAASGMPTIFLGDGKGNWKRWATVKWPLRIDYGGAAIGDFNKDKKMDVAFAIHLKGMVILYGDGNGNFTIAHQEDRFPSRRLMVTDVDADGWQDVVVLWEGPLARGQDMRVNGYAGLRAYLNRNKGKDWEGVNVSDPKFRVSGDWLASGNFNGDKRPDFIGSSMYFNSIHNLFLSSEATGTKYDAFDDPQALVIPGRAVYHAVTAGKFSSKTTDDAIVTSVRRWPPRLNPEVLPPPPLSTLVSLDAISFADGTPKRTPIMRYDGRSIAGLNHGDFDGDGNEDIMFTRSEPREAVLLLGDGKGGYKRGQVEGLVVSPQTNYDLMVADVNNDSRPDVILMYETDSTTALAEKNGSIQVFLNRGASK